MHPSLQLMVVTTVCNDRFTMYSRCTVHRCLCVCVCVVATGLRYTKWIIPHPLCLGSRGGKDNGEKVSWSTADLVGPVQSRVTRQLDSTCTSRSSSRSVFVSIGILWWPRPRRHFVLLCGMPNSRSLCGEPEPLGGGCQGRLEGRRFGYNIYTSSMVAHSVPLFTTQLPYCRQYPRVSSRAQPLALPAMW